jgi:hypothetical protein
MALPPDHPFWLALAVTVGIAALSALIVYVRADRIVSATTAAAFDDKRLRRTASSGIAGSALLFGAAVSGFFLALEPRFPDLATDLYRIGSVVIAVLLSLAAVRLRRNSKMRGVPELVALNLLWAAGFGWLLPAIAHPGVSDSSPGDPVPQPGFGAAARARGSRWAYSCGNSCAREHSARDCFRNGPLRRARLRGPG